MVIRLIIAHYSEQMIKRTILVIKVIDVNLYSNKISFMVQLDSVLF